MLLKASQETTSYSAMSRLMSGLIARFQYTVADGLASVWTENTLPRRRIAGVGVLNSFPCIIRPGSVPPIFSHNVVPPRQPRAQP